MTPLCFIDTETTGLDPEVHQAYEVAWAFDHGPIERLVLPHTLEGADPYALKVGHYLDRDIFAETQASKGELSDLRRRLRGVTLVGSNPAFDASFLKKVFGEAPWHHRLVNVAEGGMWVFNWDRPKGLAAVAEELRALDYEIPEPDHTAAGDVATTRAVYYALRTRNKAMHTLGALREATA